MSFRDISNPAHSVGKTGKGCKALGVSCCRTTAAIGTLEVPAQVLGLKDSAVIQSWVRWEGWRFSRELGGCHHVQRQPSHPAACACLESLLSSFNPSVSLSRGSRYLYLLFCEDDVLSLEDWVFNTEAHPLPINHTDFKAAVQP